MKKILVVDNHPVILEFMSKILNRAGFEVVTAQDGLSALDLMQTHTPDVMFIDLVMPNIDGKKLCHIIRRMPQFNHTRLIILSGIACEEQINLDELGAEACIAKGNFAEMSRHVLTLLGESDSPAPVETESKMFGFDALHPRAITQELLAANRHFQLILESIAEGIVELNSEYRIIYANPTAKAIIGMADEKLLGAPFAILFEEADQQVVKNKLQNLDDLPSVISEDSPVAMSGKKLAVKFVPIRGEASGIIAILNDISEKKRLADQLQRAQKMEAVGLLAGGIAHDFNNILTAIVGNVSLAKMYLKPEEKAFQKLQEAEKASLRARNLTLQLLTFAKGGAPIKRPVSLAKIIPECCKYALKDPAVQCRIELDEDLWRVDVDKGQFSQAIHNILTNAEQAMPHGGLVRITARNRVYDPRVDAQMKFANYVELTITDQGEGIAEEHLSKIFDPYFTTRQKGGGLGLTIAYSIVKNHKGVLTVESTPGTGTSVSVQVPAALKPRREAGKIGLFKARGKVLVMDDEEIVRDVVSEMLEFIGFAVEVVADGAAAVERYEAALKSDAPFDVVIMDLIVPEGLGGKDAVKQLLEVDPKAKVIVSSGYSNDPIMSKHEEYGFKGVAIKPFKIEDLSRTLQEVINGSV